MDARPRYHISAPSNWLNDPNGPIDHGGRYHLFYQYNPAAPRWERPHWGHVSSPDLLHWVDHPTALAPSVDGPDRDGCWSGCARVIDGRPTIFYTGVVGEDDDRVESVCRADGSPDLLHWSPRRTPLIAGPPAGLGTGHHRDPYVFRHGARWRLLLGSGLRRARGRAGAVLLYESPDLDHWEYRGVLYERPEGEGPIDTGPVWECPQLVRLHGRDVLIVSVQMPETPRPLRYAVYFIGTVAGGTFHPDALGFLDHGDVFYAPAVMVDRSGRHLMWGWLQESMPAAVRRADHSGALSLPRQLDLVGGRVTAAPVPELLGARALARRLSPARASTPEVVETPGPHYELALSVEGRSGAAAVELLTADGSAACSIDVDVAAGTVRTRTAAAESHPITRRAGGGPIGLRVFVDASVVEVFVDDAWASTTRVYDHDGAGLRLSTNGDATFVAARLYAVTAAAREAPRAAPDGAVG